jgi:hypothetical protein
MSRVAETRTDTREGTEIGIWIEETGMEGSVVKEEEKTIGIVTEGEIIRTSLATTGEVVVSLPRAVQTVPTDQDLPEVGGPILRHGTHLDLGIPGLLLQRDLDITVGARLAHHDLHVAAGCDPAPGRRSEGTGIVRMNLLDTETKATLWQRPVPHLKSR